MERSTSTTVRGVGEGRNIISSYIGGGGFVFVDDVDEGGLETLTPLPLPAIYREALNGVVVVDVVRFEVVAEAKEGD